MEILSLITVATDVTVIPAICHFIMTEQFYVRKIPTKVIRTIVEVLKERLRERKR